ncbi:MAG: hypothetical protein ACE5HS_23245 [bacterium]
MISRISHLAFIFLAVTFCGCDLKFQDTSTDVQDEQPIQLTWGPGLKSQPAWSPDGSKIAYSEARWASELLSISFDGQIVDAIGSTKDEIRNNEFDISPATGELVYAARSKFHLWKVNLAQKTEQLLTPNLYSEIQPAWSPDGQWIAFSAMSEAGGPRRIWLVSADGQTTQQISRGSGSHFNPTWSPDGKNIAYVVRQNSESGIWVMAVDSPQKYKLTPDYTHNFSPDWSPDSGTIVFTASRNDTLGIWSVPARGGRAEKLSRTFKQASDPKWSPDGTRIAFLTGGAIWIMNPRGEILAQADIYTVPPRWAPSGDAFLVADSRQYSVISLYSFPDQATSQVTGLDGYFRDSNPAWFPDNQTIAFVRAPQDLFSEFQIWKASLSGEKPTPLFPNAHALERQTDPAVSPDGNWVLYSSFSTLTLASTSDEIKIDLTPYIGSSLDNPSWSPDGDAFVCTHSRSNSLKIFARHPVNQFEKINEIRGDYRYPSWSRAHPVFGSYLAMEGDVGIYIVAIGETQPNLVIVDGRHPCWSPDGQTLAYVKWNQLFMQQALIKFPE